MKKILSIVLLCASLLTVLGFSVSASSAAEWAPITSQLSPEIRSLLNNTDLYDDSMEGITVEDQPIITVYNGIFWEYSGLSLNDRVEKIEAEEVWTPSYILMNSYARVAIIKDSTKIKLRETYTPDTLPTYLKDLASSIGKNTTILGKTRTISNVVCFDGTSSYKGVAVYYVTDTNETFVRYYDSRTSNAVEFTLADFQEYGVIYHNYITSDEANYDENGNPLCGSSSFTTFIQSEEMLNGEYHHYGRDYYRDPPEPEFPIETVSTVAAVVLWALVVVLLIIRKKIKGKKTAE